jgi:SAM-dependent methyltransferase
MSTERRRDGQRGRGLSREDLHLSWGDIPYSVAPYVPTPIDVVRSMLKLAGVGPEDVLYDLGCGDGRILFTAVEEFHVKKAVGYDLNPTMCNSVQLKIAEKGLGDRIEVVNGNFFLADITGASVVTLYLTTSGNTKLRPKLADELNEGARVVSHDFPIQGWSTRKDDIPEYFQMGSHKIYLYAIPEAYKRTGEVTMVKEEESRWKRIRDIFLGNERRG